MGRLCYWVVMGIGLWVPGSWGQGGAPTTRVAEARAHDYGWGVANDRNLLGRFSKRTFTLPRLARAQNYFLRLYNNSSPVCYSHYAAALHIDYPL